ERKMLDHMSRRARSLLSLTLTSLALATSILAFSTSYWCEGTHKVVKPLCLSPVKTKNCGHSLVDFAPGTGARQLANAVHYIWETGEDKYMFRYFHTGFWHSCEKHYDGKGLERHISNTEINTLLLESFSMYSGEKCRSFIELTPASEQGKLTLSA
uniref:Uncharacterized protein n=1 Tax=Lepisosteus oculatus TaxID=7918 RepID=W5MNB3_LEPOC